MFHLEKAVDMFLWGAVPHVGVGVLAHHVIDGAHDVRHLLEQEGVKTRTRS